MDSFELVCRVCLQYNSDSNSFLDEVEYEDYVKLENLFQKVTNIEIRYEDGKPCRLCQECTERLLNSYDFICSVEKAEVHIESILGNDVHQSEEDIEHLDSDAKTDVNYIEIEDIEVLDEEFQIDHDEPVTANEVVVSMDDFSIESEEGIFDDSAKTTEVITETRRSEDTVGSRLSKRLLSSHYKCSSCQRSFAKIQTLDRHIKIAHTAIPREELASITTQLNSASNEKQIACSYCPQMFKRRNNYIRHLTTSHSKDVEQLSEEDKQLIKTKHNYKRSNCPYCGKNFTQASLIVHIRRHTGENPYQCDECEKAFPRRQDLVVHQRKHTGEKPHICTVCGKSFSRTNKLARHMRVHTGERPYKCTKCQRSFAQSNDLKIHMRRHTGERPYKCSVCMEAFICGAALRTHRKQKNHLAVKDEYDDPFANWRVCKRGLKANNVQSGLSNINSSELHIKAEELDHENREKFDNIEFEQVDGE